MLDGPGLCLPRQIVTLSTDLNGVGSVRTGVFLAGHVSCFQLSPYSLWTSLTGVVRSGTEEMNGTPTSQCDFMTDSVVVYGDITMTGRTALHIVQGRVKGQHYRDNVLTPFVIPFARRVGRSFVFEDDNVSAHRA